MWKMEQGYSPRWIDTFVMEYTTTWAYPLTFLNENGEPLTGTVTGTATGIAAATATATAPDPTDTTAPAPALTFALATAFATELHWSALMDRGE